MRAAPRVLRQAVRDLDYCFWPLHSKPAVDKQINAVGRDSVNVEAWLMVQLSFPSPRRRCRSLRVSFSQKPDTGSA